MTLPDIIAKVLEAHYRVIRTFTPTTYGCVCGREKWNNAHLAQVLSEAVQQDANDYVAWCRYKGEEDWRNIVTCDSDAPGAFKVYRAAHAEVRAEVEADSIAALRPAVSPRPVARVRQQRRRIVRWTERRWLRMEHIFDVAEGSGEMDWDDARIAELTRQLDAAPSPTTQREEK